MTNVRNALIHSLSGKYVIKVISLVSTIAIARLLTPAEIGTFAIASAVVMIIAEFRMLGANTYLIREATINDAKIRSSYGLTILISWSLGAIIFIAAPYLANFFDLRELKYIFWILTSSFLFAPYISIPNALLSREYQFGKITIINVAGAVSQFAIVVILIYLGFSYYSLALSQVFSVVIKFVLSIYFIRHYRIYLPVFSGLKPIASLGVYTTLGNLFRKSQLTLPDMILGRMSTPQNVGIFSRGIGFIEFISDSILSGIAPVATPYLARSKNLNENFSDSYCFATSLITFVLWPVLIVCSVASYPAIVLLFGSQWEAAAPIASILAFWGIFRSGHVLAPKALIVFHLEKIMVLKELFVVVLFIGILVYAFKYELTGLAYGFIVIGVIDFILSISLLRYLVGISFKSQFESMCKSLIVLLVCWLTVYILSLTLDFYEGEPIITLLYIIMILPPVWVSMAFILNHPIKKEIMGLLNNIKRNFVRENT